MKINFTELKEIDVVNMNGGNGTIKSRMFMNDNCKIIKAILEPNASHEIYNNSNKDIILLDITVEE